MNQPDQLPAPIGYVAARHDDSSDWGSFEPHDTDLYGEQPRKGWWPVWDLTAIKAERARADALQAELAKCGKDNCFGRKSKDVTNHETPMGRHDRSST